LGKNKCKHLLNEEQNFISLTILSTAQSMRTPNKAIPSLCCTIIRQFRSFDDTEKSIPVLYSNLVHGFHLCSFLLYFSFNTQCRLNLLRYISC